MAVIHKYGLPLTGSDWSGLPMRVGHFPVAGEIEDLECPADTILLWTGGTSAVDLSYADGDGKIVYYHQPVRKHTTATEFDVRDLQWLPRVDMVLSYVGADGTMIEAAANAGAKGIVSAGTGAGRPTPAEDAAFDKCFKEKGMIMCLCSRVASGRVVRSPGLQKRGFVAGDNLQPWKARLLLSLALTKTTDPDDTQRMFDTY